ncbi:MAG: hypothetical protein LBQ58_04745 [Synergistaceae bacterium]|jgi:processive 1,2-diacylglycerol beta-glucosyltransferase|nr:hypothetical protein [Synergistaceae bacterium]
MARRVAVFYASFGYGHKAAANALCEWCHALYPNSITLCRDLADYIPKLLKGSVSSSYFTMTRKTPWLWDRLYRDTDIVSKRRLASAFWNDIHKSLNKTYLRHLFSEIDKFDPHAVLSTHFFGMSSLLDKWEHRTPIYSVSTDYATHSLQRDPRFDGWFVGSAESARQHRADNIPTSDYAVMDFGIPVSRDYIASPTRSEARRMLEIEEDRPVVTVIGDRYGISKMDAIVESMMDFSGWKIEIICCDNTRTYEQMRDKYYPFRHITIRDSVPNIADFYAASDIVALNPNGVRIAEAATAGTAMLLLDPLPGLERYNCDYALENGAAKRVFENRRVGEQISELLESRETLERMRSNAIAMSRPEAGKHILSYVMERLDMAEKHHAAKQSDKSCGTEEDAAPRKEIPEEICP